MAHYMGCGFHYISHSGPGTWITLMNLENSSWSVRYVFSVYFSFVTMSTIGYGDIYPVSVQEKIYVMIMLIIGCGWFAYVVNAVGQIFSEMQMKNKEIREKEFKILEYMRSRNVSKNLQLKVVKYLDFVVSKESNKNIHGEKILETMPKDIKEQVIRECYKPILMKHFIFKTCFSSELLDKLITHMKEVNFGPGEAIFNQNEGGRELFFIKEGRVDLILKSQSQKTFLISSLKDNQFFGENQFFQITRQNSYSAISKQPCSLVFFSLDDFLELAEQSPKDMEIYCQLKDKYAYNKQILDCEICLQGKHNFNACPEVFYYPKKLLFISKFNRNTPHCERTAKERPRERNSSSLKQKNYIQKSVREFRLCMEKHILGQDSSDRSDNQSYRKSKDSSKLKKNNQFNNEIIEDFEGKNSEIIQINRNESNLDYLTDRSLENESQNSKKKKQYFMNKEQKKQYVKERKNKFHQELLELEKDRDFFKKCIQLEFVDNILQQCSEYETDSAEDYISDYYQILNNCNDEQSFCKTSQEIQSIDKNHFDQLDDQQKSSSKIENLHLKPSISNDIIQEERDLSSFKRNSLINISENNQTSFKLKTQENNLNNEAHQIINLDQISFSTLKNGQNMEESQFNNKQVAPFPKNRTRQQSRLNNEFSIQRPGKKRTYIESNQMAPIQASDYGINYCDNQMYVSDGIGQEKKQLAHSVSSKYLNKFGRRKSYGNPKISSQNQFQYCDMQSSQGTEEGVKGTKKLTFISTSFPRQVHLQQSLEEHQSPNNNINQINEGGTGSTIINNRSCSQQNQFFVLQQLQQQIKQQDEVREKTKRHLPTVYLGNTQIGLHGDREIPFLQFSGLSHFDTMKCFKNYFPYFNVHSVLKNCRRLNQNRIKQINLQKKRQKGPSSKEIPGIGLLKSSRWQSNTLINTNNQLQQVARSKFKNSQKMNTSSIENNTPQNNSMFKKSDQNNFTSTCNIND